MDKADQGHAVDELAVVFPHGVRLHGRAMATRSRAIVWATARACQPDLRADAQRCDATVPSDQLLSVLRSIACVHPGEKMSRVTDKLQRSVASERDDAFGRGMHFPIRWDPYFREYITLADVYRYPGKHYDYHRRQL